MVLENSNERYHYMRGYFAGVCAHPEKYLKEDLIFYFKELRKFFDLPYAPMDDSILGRSNNA